MISQKELQTKIEEYKRRIAVAQGNIIRAEEQLKQFNNSKFKAGDFGFHKKLGNVMIMSLKLYKSGLAYEVQFVDGRTTVEESEVLPYNDTTKTLYGKV